MTAISQGASTGPQRSTDIKNHCEPHSTATHPKALGADDRLLAQLMGHRDARSVEKYAKLGSAAIRAGLERLHKRRRGEE